MNESEDLGKDTSLANTMKELNTLAQLQGKDLETTIPDSQQPNLTGQNVATSVPNSQQPHLTLGMLILRNHSPFDTDILTKTNVLDCYIKKASRFTRIFGVLRWHELEGINKSTTIQIRLSFLY